MNSLGALAGTGAAGQRRAAPAGPRYEARRETIITAAALVLSEGGPGRLTLSAVGELLHCHPVSLSYYFKRKEDLEAAVLADTADRLTRMLEAAKREDGREMRLQSFVRSYFDTRRRAILKQERPLVPLVGARSAVAPSHVEEVGEGDRVSMHVAELISPQASRCEERDHQLAQLVLSFLAWSDGWLWLYRPADFDGVARKVSDLLTSGLLAFSLPIPTSADGSHRRPQPCTTRDRLVVAGTKLMNQHGYNGVSIDRVSAEARVTKGSFYHQFSDKDELLSECLLSGLRTFEDILMRSGAERDAASRLLRVVAACSRLQAMSAGGKFLHPGVLVTAGLKARRGLLIRYMQIAHAISGLVSQGAADGSCRPVDPTIAAHYVLMLVAMARFPAGTVHSDGGRSLETAFLQPALQGLA